MDRYVAGTSFIAFHFTAMTKTNKFNGENVDYENNHGWGFSKNQPIVCKITMRIIQLKQKHSKREHHILFWIKMTTHLWIILM